MQTFIYHKPKTLNTIEKVKNHMEDLEKKLTNTSLENLSAFNHTYWIITRNVYEKLGKAYFENDSQMKRIDVNFANYYFAALDAYCNNKPCPPAWKVLFDLCKSDSQYQFIYMALGVNAHVNNDLPQTLNDVMQGSSDDTDYVKVNTVIKNSLSEVIFSLQEKRKPYKHVAEYLFPTYKNVLSFLIKNWRSHAWKAYHELHTQKTNVADIEVNALTFANKLASVKNITDIPKVLSFIQ